MIIDISHHQRPEAIDYGKLASQIDGVILRVAYGTGAPGKFDGADPSFTRHYREFHSRGVPVGAYHYITEYQNIDAQARLFIETVKDKEMELGYWCDVELEQGAERLTARSVIRWMELVEAEIGKCGIYTGRWCWRDIMGDEYARYADRKLWMSAYTASPEPYIPHGWSDYHLWQYTSSGRLAGYAGNLDMSKRGRMDDIMLDIQPLSQLDPRWKDAKLGISATTIGGYGCLITSVSMMLKHFGFDIDPLRLNNLLVNNGGYYNGNLFVWGSLEKIFNGVSFGIRYQSSVNDKIDEQLRAGKPVIINVDYVPSTAVIDEHWVLVVGKVGGNYVINDPRDGQRHVFNDIYGDPKAKIYNVCTYNFTGTITQPEPETPLYRVRVTIPDLFIRGGAGKTFPVVQRFASGEYNVYEEKNGYGRVGINKWLSLSYTVKVGVVEPLPEPEQFTDADKLRMLWEAHKELHK